MLAVGVLSLLAVAINGVVGGKCPGGCEVETSKVFVSESRTNFQAAANNLNAFLKTCDNAVAKGVLFFSGIEYLKNTKEAFLDAVQTLNPGFTPVTPLRSSFKVSAMELQVPNLGNATECSLGAIYEAYNHIERVLCKADEILAAFSGPCISSEWCEKMVLAFSALYEELKLAIDDYAVAVNKCREYRFDCGCTGHWGNHHSEAHFQATCNVACPGKLKIAAAEVLLANVKYSWAMSQNLASSAVTEQCCCAVNAAYKRGALRASQASAFFLNYIYQTVSPPVIVGVPAKAIDVDNCYGRLIDNVSGPHFGRSCPQACQASLQNFYGRGEASVANVQQVLCQLAVQCADGTYCYRLIEVIATEYAYFASSQPLLSAIIDTCTGC